MRKLLIILFWLISLSLSGTTYYVAPTGSNSYPGTFTNPWKTWTKAFQNVSAGDIVYIRGGIYYSETDNGGERGFPSSGSIDNPIRIEAYPADWAAGNYPILDCTNHNEAVNYNRAIYISNREYIFFKGLHIRNVKQTILNCNVMGIYTYKAGNLKFEDIVIYEVDGSCFDITDWYGTVILKNCDAHDCCDWWRDAVYPNPGSPGQNGVSFNHEKGGEGSELYYEGCRAWNFSDNGFAGYSQGYIEFKNCWAFSGGELSGGGCGFKIASVYGGENTLPLARLVQNCIGAANYSYGFSQNYSSDDIPLNMHVYNNFAYHNGYRGSGVGYGRGFVISNYYGSTPPPNEMFANNLSYDNENGEIFVGDNYTHQYNSWDQSVTVSAADFVSLDTAQLRWTRKAWNDPDDPNGLPDITFGHLTETSDLIGKGIDVGTIYDGEGKAWNDPPSLGPFEFAFPEEPAAPQVNTAAVIITSPTTVTVGGNTITDGGSAITAKGVCWGTSLNPDMGDNVIACGSGSADYTTPITTGLVSGVTYHVRAYVTNIIDTTYGADEEWEMPPDAPVGVGGPVGLGGKLIMHLGKIMTVP